MPLAQCHLRKIQQYMFDKEANSYASNTWDIHQIHQNDYLWGRVSRMKLGNERE